MNLPGQSTVFLSFIMKYRTLRVHIVWKREKKMFAQGSWGNVLLVLRQFSLHLWSNDEKRKSREPWQNILVIAIFSLSFFLVWLEASKHKKESENIVGDHNSWPNIPSGLTYSTHFSFFMCCRLKPKRRNVMLDHLHEHSFLFFFARAVYWSNIWSGIPDVSFHFLKENAILKMEGHVWSGCLLKKSWMRGLLHSLFLQMGPQGPIIH